MAISGTAARTIVADSAIREANTTTWSNERVDQAIMMAMEIVNTEYKLLTAVSTANTISKATEGSSSWSNGTATLDIGASHGILAGDPINLSGVAPSGWYGRYRVTDDVQSAGTIDYALTTDPGSKTSEGTVSLVNLPLSGLTPKVYRSRFIAARQGLNRAIKHVNWDDILEYHETDTGQAEPLRIAYEHSRDNRPLLHPAPDAVYAFAVTHLDVIDSWTPAGTPPTTFKLDDEIMRPILYWGVPALMKHQGEAELAKIDRLWAKMVDYIEKVAPRHRDLGVGQMIPLEF